ncbi:hypothetical protein F2Q69_00059293 [Brassica cretica]|uniref:Uncharacterized protein n=1 Tax=Brassica cretica TaxID=69181 RepID=A0A8S9RQ26_BRACR|nr:hypothetical protein F2Q69_00059293 [Brassica cretica]
MSIVAGTGAAMLTLEGYSLRVNAGPAPPKREELPCLWSCDYSGLNFCYVCVITFQAISRATSTAGASLHLIDDGLSPPRTQMDSAEERRETKRQKKYINMLGYVADSEYGIPRRCAWWEND